MDDETIYEELWKAFYSHFDSDYDKAAERIRSIDFTSIKFHRQHISDSRSHLYLTVRRPGLLIGLKGELAVAISKHFEQLGLKIHIEEEIERSIADHIIPYYSDFEDESCPEYW